MTLIGRHEDIGGAGMSLNDLIPDYDDGYDVGHDDGYKMGSREAVRILRDLITELRDMHADGDVCSSLDAADHAEARLRLSRDD